MTKVFEGLKPAPVWSYFDDICQIPRPSKKEEKILSYLTDFCKKHSLSFKQDKIKNIVITKPASAGMENRKKVVLQSHVDMVCEKNKETKHDFDKDPIRAYIDGEWVKAHGTTLGADNGMGVATMLALLASKDIAHPAMDCLFTIDEETGLNGAAGLEKGFISGDILLNLDTEDEGVFTIGCAGGMDTMLTITPAYENLPAGHELVTVEVKGLNGGHSGVDINKGHACSIKIMSPLLLDATRELKARIVTLQGGNLRNAIAREMTAVVAVPNASMAAFTSLVDAHYSKAKNQYQKTEPNLKLVCAKSAETSQKCFTKEFAENILSSLVECPHGVLKMSEDIPGLVETSTNLAAVRIEDGKMVVSTSQRSSLPKDKFEVSKKIIKSFERTKAEAEAVDKYPGWTPNVKSEILELFKTTYKKMFGKEPTIEVIHAGLECGVIGEKQPGMDMISIGPTIRAPHSPDERVEIPSVQKYWDLLIAALKDIPQKV
jgi:dipeptidase D